MGSLRLSTADFLEQIILCCGGLPCTLKGVQQHLWPPVQPLDATALLLFSPVEITKITFRCSLGGITAVSWKWLLNKKCWLMSFIFSRKFSAVISWVVLLFHSSSPLLLGLKLYTYLTFALCHISLLCSSIYLLFWLFFLQFGYFLLT